MKIRRVFIIEEKIGENWFPIDTSTVYIRLSDAKIELSLRRNRAPIRRNDLRIAEYKAAK